ncbi:hypothetical protein [Campylobacter concisus]|uniref:hypothetical protein n=1 Tax=Campylobacter concisus TaxID=199 RepID=UPI00214D4974|nr:hypothetical protein [Campylobacter concisus]
MDLFCLIFDDYETLDLMGPVEFLARVPEININYVSFDGGMKRSKQGFLIKTKNLTRCQMRAFCYSLVVRAQGHL